MCTKDKCCSEPGESKQRESGFYWIKRKSGRWVVAEWLGSVWRSNATLYNDSDFGGIDERRIERQLQEATGCGCNDINSNKKYYLISILYQKDDGELWVYNFVKSFESLPTRDHLKDIAIDASFSKYIGITGISEMSENDFKSFLLNEG